MPGMPPLASAHAAEMDHMIYLVHILMAVLFAGWFAFFTYLLVRFRRGRNPRADYHGARSHASTWLEVAVAIVEAVLLIGFSIPFWARKVNAFPPADQAERVRIVAQQFAWNVHYPGPDGVFGRTDISLVNEQTNPIGLDRKDPDAQDDITTVNQLHLPVDRPAIIDLSTKDVIHSLALNEMRVKQDAIPGMSIPVWFVPTVAGKYEIACAQLCGLGHYRMQGFFTVHSAGDYAQWLAGQAQARDAQPAAADDFWD
jgi:cytochrome c oxidase subunit 2